MDERHLVERVLNGDEKAFEDLHGATASRLRRVAAGFLGDDVLADDIVQETYARALPRLKEFRFDSKILTWLTRFTINLSLQALRRRKKDLLTDTNTMETLMKAGPERLSPELRQALRDEVARLDPLSRSIVQAKDIEGRPFLEVAKALKLPPGTVMSRLARARTKLREALQARKDLYKDMWEQ